MNLSKSNIRLGIGGGMVFAAALALVGLGVAGDQSRETETSQFDAARVGQYMDDYIQMTSREGNEKENILIVISDSRPDSHGAVDIVEALNNQYFLQYESAEAKDSALAQLRADGVDVSENVVHYIQGGNYMSWGIEKIGLDEAITAANEYDGAASVTAAIIDTGLDMDAFRAKFPDRELMVYDALTGDETETVDNHSHGTHVTGTVTEGTSSNVKIMAIRASEEGKLYSTDVVNGINYAVSHGVDVINMSFGSTDYSTSEYAAISNAANLGVVVAAATGNDGKDAIYYPAGFDNTIAVGAVGLNNTTGKVERASYSNYGEGIDFMAPGSLITSISNSSNSTLKSGTSMATPHIAAVIAEMKSFNKSLNVAEMRELLERHVDDLGEVGYDYMNGYGLVNLSGADFCKGVYCDKYGVFTSKIPDVVNLVSGEEIADVTVGADGITVAAAKACKVLATEDDVTYQLVDAANTDTEDTYKFLMDFSKNLKVYVLLKGDLNNDGMVNLLDANVINRSLLSVSAQAYKGLTVFEKAAADLNGDNLVNLLDTNVIYRSLLSKTAPAYKVISW